MMRNGNVPMARKSVAEVEELFCVPEFKAAQDGTVEGYGAIYGNVDKGGEVVVAGAFASSLKLEPSVKMLWQHDPSQPIGVWEEVREDEKGLYVKGRILREVEKGREALALIKAKAIDGLSIGYKTLKSERDADGNRLLMECDLWEVSLVTFPMNPSARIGAAKAAAMSRREFERSLLRDSKYSRTVVNALMADGYKGVQALRDSGDEDFSELLEAVQASSLLNSLS